MGRTLFRFLIESLVFVGSSRPSQSRRELGFFLCTPVPRECLFFLPRFPCWLIASFPCSQRVQTSEVEEMREPSLAALPCVAFSSRPTQQCRQDSSMALSDCACNGGRRSVAFGGARVRMTQHACARDVMSASADLLHPPPCLLPSAPFSEGFRTR